MLLEMLPLIGIGGALMLFAIVYGLYQLRKIQKNEERGSTWTAS